MKLIYLQAMLGLLLVVSALKVCFSDISCLFQALQNRNLDSAFTIILWAQLFAYILLDLPKVLETGGQELVSAVVYFALCSVPAWAGFRSRGGEHAVHRSYALMLSCHCSWCCGALTWSLPRHPS